jgi:hypothetical protein
MFVFSPPDVDLHLDVNRVIVLVGHPRTLEPLFDYLTAKECGTHRSRYWPESRLVRDMAENVRLTGGNTVLLVTPDDYMEEITSIPPEILHSIDLLLRGRLDGVIEVLKDRSMLVCRDNPTCTIRCNRRSKMDPQSPHAVRILEALSPSDTVPKAVSFQLEPPSSPPRITLMVLGSEGSLTLNDGKGRELIRITPDGEAFVRGEKTAANQQDIYEMFRAWVQSQSSVNAEPSAHVPVWDTNNARLTPNTVAPTSRLNVDRVVTKGGQDITAAVLAHKLAVVRDAFRELSDSFATSITDGQADAWDRLIRRLRDVDIKLTS